MRVTFSATKKSTISPVTELQLRAAAERFCHLGQVQGAARVEVGRFEKLCQVYIQGNQ